jgi:arylsulfatase A-like enzyme
MKNSYLRNSGLNRFVPFLAILLLVVLGVSVFLLMRLRTDRSGSTTRGPVAIHLVDEFKPENVEGTPQEAVIVPPRAEWRFDGSTPSPSGETDSATLGWQAGPDVNDFQVRDGRLVGRSTSDCPIIYAERTVGLDDPHQICAFEIRMRISAGAELAVTWRPSEKLDLEAIAESAKEGHGWWLAAPIATDNEMHTYTFHLRSSNSLSEIRHVLIRPTDVQGATFEIEFVRVLSRKEYFASNSPLVSWEGLAGIYHKTLVAKTAEVIRFPLSLPDRPWLDLAIGTIEDGPVTFQVKIHPAGGRTEEAILLVRTITTPNRWEPVQVDLSDYAGQEVSLSLSLAAEKNVSIGYWGSPVIRNSGAIPPPAISENDAFSRETPQGVILIWADAVRWDHLNAYGYPRETAPVLSRMAAEGALFHDCVSQATWTLPSTTSLLTSLYVTTHGHGVVAGMEDGLPVTATIMPEVFHDAGYATLSFSSIHFTGQHFNMHQGVDESHESDSLVESKGSTKTAREYVDRLLPWLEAHREVPFFVFLHVFDPHAPYEPYPPYDTLWADPARKKEHEMHIERVKEFIVGPDKEYRKRTGMPYPEELEKAGIDPDDFISLPKDLYDGSIRAMDTEIGRLLERLEELGLDEKTLVIFISDHGEEFFDHGGMAHSTTVYSEQTHVPLIVRWPGVVPEGAEVFETVRTIDLMPTILELCRLPLPGGMQGQSLVPLLAAAKRTPSESTATSQRNATSTAGRWRNEPAVSERLLSEREKRTNPEKRDSYAIILDGWKLNVYEPLEGNPEYELYDHRKDPLDQVNVADKHPEIVERLAEELKAWKEKAAAARLTPDSELEKKLTSEQLQHLRSLGYIR